MINADGSNGVVVGVLVCGTTFGFARRSDPVGRKYPIPDPVPEKCALLTVTRPDSDTAPDVSKRHFGGISRHHTRVFIDTSCITRHEACLKTRVGVLRHRRSVSQDTHIAHDTRVSRHHTRVSLDSSVSQDTHTWLETHVCLKTPPSVKSTRV
jgi:hypothetical protein